MWYCCGGESAGNTGGSCERPGISPHWVRGPQLLQGHLEHVSTRRWPYAVADDFFTKQLPNNVTWLLTLMYSLAQTGASLKALDCSSRQLNRL